MKEVILDLISTLRNRARNPLIGSFLLSFIIFNWKVFSIYLFSSYGIEWRIAFIEQYYSKKEIFFWSPLLISLCYVIALPYVHAGCDFLIRFAIRKRNITLWANKIDVLTLQRNAARVEREIADEKAGTSQVNELQRKNADLTTELNTLKGSLEAAKKTHEALIKQNEELAGELDERAKQIDELEKDSAQVNKSLLMLSAPPNQKNFRDIKLFLRDNLNDHEVSRLKAVIKNSLPVSLIEFRGEIASLMIKAGIFEVGVSDSFKLTEIGRTFINNLD